MVGWDWVVNFVVGWLADSGAAPWVQLEEVYWRYGAAASQWLLVLNLALSLGCFAAAVDAAPAGFYSNGGDDDGAGAGNGAGVGSAAVLLELPRAWPPQSASELNAAVAALEAMDAGGAAAAVGVATDRVALRRFCDDAGLSATHHAK